MFVSCVDKVLFHFHMHQLCIVPLFWSLLSSPHLSFPLPVGLQGVSFFFAALHFHVRGCFVSSIFGVLQCSQYHPKGEGDGSNIPKWVAKQHHSNKRRHP